MSGSTASRGYQYPEDGDFQSEFPAISRQAMERVDVDMASALSGVSGVSTRVSALEARPPSVRYDTTAGVAVYVHDGATERLVSYDSGWRDVSELLSDGWVLGEGGRLLMRRQDNTVSLYMQNLDPADATTFYAIRNIPTGLHPAWTHRRIPIATDTDLVTTCNVRRNERDVSIGKANGYKEKGPVGDRWSGAEASWTTTDAIPTTPFGTPA